MRRKGGSDGTLTGGGAYGLLKYHLPKELDVSKTRREARTAWSWTEEGKGKSLWRAATVEFVATAVFNVARICLVVSVTVGNGGKPEYDHPGAVASLALWPLLALTIYASAAPSGGHFNSTISITACLTGLMSPLRALVYCVAQICGAIVAAYLVKVILSDYAVRTSNLGMCGKGPMSNGQAFLAEFLFTFAQLFIIWGAVMDPIQKQVYGKVFAPILVGVTIGVLVFISSGIGLYDNNGERSSPYPYTGYGGNIPLCVGPAVAQDRIFSAEWAQWVFIVPDVVAAVVIAVLYHLVPPSHELIEEEKQRLKMRQLGETPEVAKPRDHLA